MGNSEALVIAAKNAVDLKPGADSAGKKSAHIRARYLVNLVIEAAGPDVGRYTTEEILRAALFLGRGT